MRILATLLVASHVVFGHVSGPAAAEEISAEKRELVASVFGKPVYWDQITPASAAEKRKELPEPEYQQWLRNYGVQLLFSNIKGKVLHEYAIREKLRPSNDDIDAIIAEAVRKYSGNLEADKDAQQKLAIRVFWLRGASRDWRTAKALYEKYGGRVAISSFGACESFEGRNAVLRDYAAAGEIKFHRGDLESAFWEKAKDERIQDVTLPPGAVAKHFAVAPWERWIRELATDAAAKNPGGAWRSR